MSARRSTSAAPRRAHKHKPAKVRTDHLRLVDQNGEVSEFACPNCQAKDDEYDELLRKFRSQSRELAELRRDKAREAREHKAWPTLQALFDYWRELTGHAKAKWTPDRFWHALTLWSDFGTGNCAAGIAGIAYQPNRKQMKNGKWEVYDSWELLFRETGTLERYIKRRPEGWELPELFKKFMEDAKHAAPV
jgi:hypothetical protein